MAADVRQAVVGWLVLLSIPLIGAVLLTTLAGDVPSWTLAAVLVGAVVLMAATSLEHRRELGRVEGALATEEERRERLETKLAETEATGGTQEPSTTREGFLFRIDTLRDEVVDRYNSGLGTTGGQDRAIHNLAKDVREEFGSSSTVDQIARDWDAPVYSLSSQDAAAALGQLRGIVMSGRLPNVTSPRS